MSIIFIVYKTTNMINGNIYIGIHKQIGSEFDGYLGSGLLLRRAVEKYGVDKFERETLYEYDSLDKCRKMEREIVNKDFCMREDTYNISIGGTGGNTLIGYDEEYRKMIIEKRRQSFMKTLQSRPPEVKEYYRLKMVEQMKRVRIQPNNKGRVYSEEIRERIKNRIRDVQSSWYTNGIETILFREGSTIPDGYYKGRTLKDEHKFKGHSKETLDSMAIKRNGGVYYNNGVTNIFVFTGDAVPIGFKRGLLRHKKTKKNWYTNGHHSIIVKEGEEVPDGYFLGRASKHNRKGLYCYYTDGMINKYLRKDITPIPDGFYIGRTDGVKNEYPTILISTVDYSIIKVVKADEVIPQGYKVYKYQNLK